MDEREHEEIDAAARRHGLTVSQWVRQALRASRRAQADVPAAHKLAVIRAAARHEGPSADIDQMLAEIESGYGAGKA